MNDAYEYPPAPGRSPFAARCEDFLWQAETLAERQPNFAVYYNQVLYGLVPQLFDKAEFAHLEETSQWEEFRRIYQALATVQRCQTPDKDSHVQVTLHVPKLLAERLKFEANELRIDHQTWAIFKLSQPHKDAGG